MENEVVESSFLPGYEYVVICLKNIFYRLILQYPAVEGDGYYVSLVRPSKKQCWKTLIKTNISLFKKAFFGCANLGYKFIRKGDSVMNCKSSDVFIPNEFDVVCFQIGTRDWLVLEPTPYSPEDTCIEFLIQFNKKNRKLNEVTGLGELLNNKVSSLTNSINELNRKFEDSNSKLHSQTMKQLQSLDEKITENFKFITNVHNRTTKESKEQQDKINELLQTTKTLKNEQDRMINSLQKDINDIKTTIRTLTDDQTRMNSSIGTIQKDIFHLPKPDPTTFFPQSQIITDIAHSKLLNEWYGNPFQKWKKIYSAGTGADFSEFHKSCDGQFATMVIVRCNKNYIFGGFCSVGWSIFGTSFKPDPNAFIWSLKNPSKGPMKISSQPSNDRQIYDWPVSGPIFGSGYDIHIDDGSICFHTYIPESPYDNNIFTGSNRFTVSLMEIYRPA